MIRFVFVFLIIACNLAAQSARALTDGLSVETGELQNGLKIYVIPDTRADVIVHMLGVRVGGADDPRGKSGMAHLLEHLMFKGTEANPKGAFDRRIEAVGGQFNAFVTRDFTAYHEMLGARHLEMVMALEADRFTGLVIRPEDVALESDVIVQERFMRVENQPITQLREVMNAQLYTHHAYGLPYGGGWGESQTITRDEVLDFYRAHYYPANAFVIVAGNTSLDEVMTLAEATYGQYQMATPYQPRKRLKEPEPIAPRYVRLEDDRVHTPLWLRRYLLPSHTQSVDEAAALYILGMVLGGGKTSRLYESLVLDKRKALHVGAYYRGLNLDYDEFNIYAEPAGDTSLETLQALVRDEIKRIIDQGINDEELERAKQQILAGTIYGRDNLRSLVNNLGTVLAAGGDVDTFLGLPEAMQSVTEADIQAVATRYLEDKRSVTGFLLPRGSDF